MKTIKTHEIEYYLGEEFKAGSAVAAYVTNNDNERIYRIVSYATIILEKRKDEEYPYYFDNTRYSNTTSKVQNAIIKKYFPNSQKLEKEKYDLKKIVKLI